MNSAREKKPPYRLLGCYRALLALLVVISHSSAYFPSYVSRFSLGNVGVFSFFVLSGFVIAEALDVFYPGQPHRFLFNRFLRLYPVYWLACIVALLIYFIKPPENFSFSLATFFSNLTILLAERLPPDQIRYISVVWAVGIELRFYFIVALLDMLVWISSRFGLQVFFKASCSVICLLIYIWACKQGLGHHPIIKFMPFFILGYYYYFIVENGDAGSFIMCLATLPMALNSYIDYHLLRPWTDIYLTTAVFLFSLVLLGKLVFIKVGANSDFLLRLDKKLGGITYPIYLIHWPVIYAVAFFDLKGYGGFLLILFVSLILSLIISMLIDVPVSRYRDKIRGQKLY